MKKRSLDLIVPFCWIFLSVSRGVFFWQKMPADVFIQDITAGSQIDRLIFVFLIATGVLILFAKYNRREKSIGLIKDNIFLIIFFAFMGLSVLWSRFPIVSFKRFIKTSGTLVMVFVIFSKEDPKKAKEFLTKYCIDIANNAVEAYWTLGDNLWGKYARYF